MSFLTDTSLQTKQSAIYEGGVCTIFRGVQFHVEVLNNSKTILGMTDCLEKLEDIEDSKMLGDLMVAHGLVIKVKQVMKNEDELGGVDTCCGGGGPSKHKQKWPTLIEVDSESPNFEDGGVYMIHEEQVSTKLVALYIAGIMFLLIAVLSIPVWPDWLFNKVFLGASYVAAPIFAILTVRFILWYIPFHFGLSLWVLPNIFYLKNVFSPLVEAESYPNLFEPVSLGIRVASLAFTSLVSFKGHEYILGRIAHRKKNETVVQWISLWVNKYSKKRYRDYHVQAVAAFYILIFLVIFYRQKWGKKVIKSKI